MYSLQFEDLKSECNDSSLKIDHEALWYCLQTIQIPLSEEEYEDSVMELKALYISGKKRDQKKCMDLLLATKDKRDEWVMEEQPHCKEYFQQFPLLKILTYVSTCLLAVGLYLSMTYIVQERVLSVSWF